MSHGSGRPRIAIISAMARNRIIGIENRLPWNLPADMRHFRTLTMGHHLIMGRKTYESIGKPLPGRTTVIVTRNKDFAAPGCIVVNSIEAAISACQGDNEAFIIGGAELYKQALDFADRIYLTKIDAIFEGDAYFPEFESASWKEIDQETFPPDADNPYAYRFVVYDKKMDSTN